MVGWYKHDIPAWMDGTEALDDGPYRAYHVICQLIYLNEGPIALNEVGIAGRCKQHILAFRRNLRTLIDLKKLYLIDGRLSNDRAATELQSVANHRATSAKGGRGSAGVAKGSRLDETEVDDGVRCDIAPNHLKTNNQATVPLLDPQHQETREEKTREEKISRVPALVFESDWPKDFRETFWQLFPKRVDKQAAFKKLEQLRRGGKVPWAALIGGVGRYAESVRGKDQTFTKGPAAWLNAGKWEDEIVAVAAFDVRKFIT